jgi:ABC-type multidrug transport system fused ATPase/permease subunit
MDEATSALDNKLNIAESLDNLGYTVIAHRLRYYKNADRILFF